MRPGICYRQATRWACVRTNVAVSAPSGRNDVSSKQLLEASCYTATSSLQPSQDAMLAMIVKSSSAHCSGFLMGPTTMLARCNWSGGTAFAEGHSAQLGTIRCDAPHCSALLHNWSCGCGKALQSFRWLRPGMCGRQQAGRACTPMWWSRRHPEQTLYPLGSYLRQADTLQ